MVVISGQVGMTAFYSILYALQEEKYGAGKSRFDISNILSLLNI
jgi:hypothetical protein